MPCQAQNKNMQQIGSSMHSKCSNVFHLLGEYEFDDEKLRVELFYVLLSRSLEKKFKKMQNRKLFLLKRSNKYLEMTITQRRSMLLMILSMEITCSIITSKNLRLCTIMKSTRKNFKIWNLVAACLRSRRLTTQLLCLNQLSTFKKIWRRTDFLVRKIIGQVNFIIYWCLWEEHKNSSLRVTLIFIVLKLHSCQFTSRKIISLNRRGRNFTDRQFFCQTAAVIWENMGCLKRDVLKIPRKRTKFCSPYPKTSFTNRP